MRTVSLFIAAIVLVGCAPAQSVHVIAPSDFSDVTLPENGWVEYRHDDPDLTFSYPRGWEVSEDRGDMDIYIQRINPFKRIVLSYCGEGCFEPTDGCIDVMPVLGVTACREIYADGENEQWNFMMRVGETDLHVMADSAPGDMPALLETLRVILASLR